MKKMSLVVLVFLISNLIFAVEAIPLPGLMQPMTIKLDKDHIYITEGASIFIYSLKNFQLIKKFGRNGEGPQEFKVTPQFQLNINVKTDVILVKSFGKLSRFTKDGNFISEEKVMVGFGGNLQPLGNRLVGLQLSEENTTRYRAVNIYDTSLNKIKELIKVEDDFQWGKGLKFRSGNLFFDTFEDKLFLCSQKDFVIDVLDSEGKKLYSFKQDIQKLKITGDMQKEILEDLRTSPRTKKIFELLKPIQFPDYFPAVRDLRIDGPKIYVLTYIEDEKKEESDWFILDLKGTLLKKTRVPMKYQSLFVYFPYEIHNDKLYQVMQNEETENCELHISDIK